VKVLLLIHNQQGTGPYPKVLEQSEALQELGAQVTLLCTSRTARIQMSETEERGVRVVVAPDLLWGRLRQGVDLWNTVRRIRFVTGGTFDVVHAIDTRPAVIFPALWRKWKVGTPLVLSWWDLFGVEGAALDRWGPLYARTLGRLEGIFEVSFRRYADRATVISTELRRRLEGLGYPSERILLQRVGCNTRAYGPGDKQVARVALGLPLDATILCYVGALRPLDQRLLVEALTLVAERYSGELLTLMIGTLPVRTAITSRPGVSWVARQPIEMVYRYLASADLCLLPLSESVANRARWPSKSADYFNAGRPVVATRVSDVEQLCAEYSLGYLAERSTPEGYAEALLRALNRRSEWEIIGRSCRRFAEEHLDVQILAKELLALYEEAQRTTRGDSP
jgi:glycosyltransferase involved in cell wall biosynthesis